MNLIWRVGGLSSISETAVQEIVLTGWNEYRYDNMTLVKTYKLMATPFTA
jgi:hypothetical protein